MNLSRALVATATLASALVGLSPGPAAAGGSPLDPVILTAENFDGTRWETAVAVTDHPARRAFIEMALDEVAKAYAIQSHGSRAACASGTNPHDNWGFEAADPDCRNELVVIDATTPLRTASINSSDDVVIYLNEHAKEIYNALGQYLDPLQHDRESVARSLLHHEHFHTMQWAITGKAHADDIWKWGAWKEGMATFAQSIGAPDVEDDPTSIFSRQSSAYLQHSETSLCSKGYSAAPYWGFLYWQDGGIETIERVIEELKAVENPGPGCSDRELGRAIDRALAARPGAHDTQAAALTDFALHAYLRDFSWGRPDGSDVRDWGANMEPVQRAVHPLPPPTVSGAIGHAWEPGSPTATYRVQAWGFQHVHVADPTVGEVSVDASDPSWAARLLVRNGDHVEVVPLEFGQAMPVDVASHDEVMVQLVRLAPTNGDASVTAT